MKVVHLTSVHGPNDPRITDRECETLAYAGHNVVLIAPRRLPLPRDNGVRYAYVKEPRNRFERMTKTMWSVYRAAVKEHADVYHFHDPELMLIGALLRLRGAHVIFDVHEHIPEDIAEKQWIPPGWRPIISLSARAALRLMQNCYSAIVTATTGVAKDFTHRRIVHVNNFPKLSSYAKLKPLSQRPPNAVYVGSITRVRGIVQLITAMEFVDGKLVLAGGFEDEELELECRALPAWSKVEYLGVVPPNEVASVLERGRVGIVTLLPQKNFAQALPTKMFEYFAAGMPAIVSTTMRVSEIVTRHRCGLAVDPFDEEKIASAISTCIHQTVASEAIGKRGQKLALSQYDWTTEGAKLVRLYTQIAIERNYAS